MQEGVGSDMGLVWGQGPSEAQIRAGLRWLVGCALVSSSSACAPS